MKQSQTFNSLVITDVPRYVPFNEKAAKINVGLGRLKLTRDEISEFCTTLEVLATYVSHGYDLYHPLTPFIKFVPVDCKNAKKSQAELLGSYRAKTHRFARVWHALGI